MSGRVAARLKELNLTLPDGPAPAANYVPATRSGNLLFIAGQIPVQGGKPQFIGKLGREFKTEDGQQAARLCALNILAQASKALDGDLDRIVRWQRARDVPHRRGGRSHVRGVLSASRRRCRIL